MLRLFSARLILSGPGDLHDRLCACLLEARRFLDSISVADLMDILLIGRESRRSIVGCTGEGLHVGFIVPNEQATMEALGLAASKAGFCSGHSTFDSAIVARELGELRGKSEVPTTIFKAYGNERDRCSKFVEVFIPKEEARIVTTWIEQEVGTHIGLTLGNASDFQKVRHALQAEGFRIPKFMNEEPMTNPLEGSTVLYFDRPDGEENLRIEILSAGSAF